MGIVSNADYAAANLARIVAEALDAQLGRDSDAESVLVDGTWYVVTSGTGEGYDYAYEVDDIDLDLDDLRDNEEWDYSMWCNGVTPIEDRTVAVAYYISTGRHLGTVGGCGSQISEDDAELLDIVRGLS